MMYKIANEVVERRGGDICIRLGGLRINLI